MRILYIYTISECAYFYLFSLCIYIFFSFPPKPHSIWEVISNNSSPRDLVVNIRARVLSCSSLLPFTSFNPSSTHNIILCIYTHVYRESTRTNMCIHILYYVHEKNNINYYYFISPVYIICICSMSCVGHTTHTRYTQIAVSTSCPYFDGSADS